MGYETITPVKACYDPGESYENLTDIFSKYRIFNRKFYFILPIHSHMGEIIFFGQNARSV